MESNQVQLQEENEFFDARESSSNVAQLLEDTSKKVEDFNDEIKDDGDDFLVKDDEDDDILKDLQADDDLADLLNEETKEETTSEIYVPPSHGQNQLLAKVKESIIPGYYVAIGDFK